MIALARLTALWRRLPVDGRPFCDRALETLGVTCELAESERAKVPRDGPLVVVANHPTGALDGLLLLSLIGSARPDVKVLANRWLGCIPELRADLIPVEVFRRRKRTRANASSIRAAIQWVRSGHALIVFPAGEVAHANDGDGRPTDSAWQLAVAHVVRSTGAAVLPVFIPGRNSTLFEWGGRIHPLLRTAMLPRELLRRRGCTVTLRVGSPIAPSRLAQFSNLFQLTSYLRIRTMALDLRRRGSAPETAPAIVQSHPQQGIAREVGALRETQVLARSGQLDVCLAHADEIPTALREIGRLREIAFRAAGEGSGTECDLDRFDRHYLHLFVWNRERDEIVGAYRAGLTDEILAQSGVHDLYTSTLFKYDRSLIEEIGPAMELGRAFVRPEYQRDYSPLLLLWKGIATLVSRMPKYRMLFGPVSISHEYGSLSRQILARFLYATAYNGRLGHLVAGRNEPAFLRPRRDLRPGAGSVVRTLTEVTTLLSEIEADGKGVPVLLRQYLKLNARLLGFNVDAAFGNALDALMLVDLLAVDRSILVRYMGADGAQAFLSCHGAPEASVSNVVASRERRAS